MSTILMLEMAIVLLLTVTLLASAAWYGSTISGSLAGSTISVTPYVIFSGVDLALPTQKVNKSKTTFKSAFCHQMNDIGLRDNEWTWIGTTTGTDPPVIRVHMTDIHRLLPRIV